MPNTKQLSDSTTNLDLESSHEEQVDLNLTHDDHNFIGKTIDGKSYTMTISLLKNT